MRVIVNSVWIALFAAMVAALGFESFTASQQIPTEQKRHHSEAAHPRATPSDTALNQPHAPEDGSKRQQKQEKAKEHAKEFAIDFFNVKLSDVLIAVFTIVLAVKTAGLFQETAGLRAAADQQASDMKDSIAVANRSVATAERALTELEAPFIGLQITEPGFGSIHRRAEQYEIRRKWNGLTFNFINYGRTAAVLMHLSDKLELCPIGQRPSLLWLEERSKPYPYGVLVGPDKPSSDSFRLFEDFFDVTEGFDKIQSNAVDMFLVGRLRYRDIFGTIFEMGFCAKFNRETSGFLMEGGDAYNYCKKLS